MRISLWWGTEWSKGVGGGWRQCWGETNKKTLNKSTPNKTKTPKAKKHHTTTMTKRIIVHDCHPKVQTVFKE